MTGYQGNLHLVRPEAQSSRSWSCCRVLWIFRCAEYVPRNMSTHTRTILILLPSLAASRLSLPPVFSDHLAKQKYARQNFDWHSQNWEHVKVQNYKSKFKLIIYTIHILPDSIHYLYLQSEPFHLHHQLQHWPNTDRWIITNWRLVRSVTCTREKSWICCCSSPQVTWRNEDETLGGGFKYFLFSPLLGKLSHLTFIFFRLVESTTNLKQLRDFLEIRRMAFFFQNWLMIRLFWLGPLSWECHKITKDVIPFRSWISLSWGWWCCPSPSLGPVTIGLEGESAQGSGSE